MTEPTIDTLVQALREAGDAMAWARQLAGHAAYYGITLSDELQTRIRVVGFDCQDLYNAVYDASQNAAQPLTGDVTDFS